MNDIAWSNGRVLMALDALVPMADRGHTLGLGVFETLRCVGGEVRHVALHRERFARGTAWLGFDALEDFDAAVQDLADAAPWAEARLRVQATPGPGGLDDPARPTVTGLASEVRRELRPVALRVASHRLDPEAPWVGLKTTQYAAHADARRQAQTAGADDALLVDRAGWVVEASTSSIALRVGDDVVCPGPRQGAVDGVTRRVLGLDVVEDAWPADRLDEVDEAVLLSAIQGVRPVASIDGRPLTTTEWTRGLQRAWS